MNTVQAKTGDKQLSYRMEHILPASEFCSQKQQLTAVMKSLLL